LVLVLAAAAHFAFRWQARRFSGTLFGLGQAGASSLGLPGLASALIPSLSSSLPRELSPIASASSAGTVRRRDTTYLVVSVSPERSEVLIDGVPRGNTPYVGEIECRRGSTIVVNVLPRFGAARTYERVCDRQEIRIVDEQD
jgi:hypothetical protein